MARKLIRVRKICSGFDCGLGKVPVWGEFGHEKQIDCYVGYGRAKGWSVNIPISRQKHPLTGKTHGLYSVIVLTQMSTQTPSRSQTLSASFEPGRALPLTTRNRSRLSLQLDRSGQCHVAATTPQRGSVRRHG